MALATDSKDVARQVLIAAECGQAPVHISRVDHHRLALQAGCAKTDLVEQMLHHGGQAARADVLRAFVDVAGDLREAANAAAEQRKGELGTAPSPEMNANAMRRCEALGGEDNAACMARVLGYGNASGSVGGGGVIREVETVVVPPGQTEVTIEPKTDNPVLVVPIPGK